MGNLRRFVAIVPVESLHGLIVIVLTPRRLAELSAFGAADPMWRMPQGAALVSDLNGVRPACTLEGDDL
jgi:hypothetical protein